jgi:hypothetical protein
MVSYGPMIIGAYGLTGPSFSILVRGFVLASLLLCLLASLVCALCAKRAFFVSAVRQQYLRLGSSLVTRQQHQMLGTELELVHSISEALYYTSLKRGNKVEQFGSV